MQELWTLYHEEIPQFLREFAATPPVLRLKAVGMNCGCEYTSFPRFRNLKPYSRFDHSVGVALIIWHFTGSMEQTLAGLFHDITTPVFAHVVDFLHGDHLRQESTEAGVAECIASSTEICGLLQHYGISIDQISDYHRYPIADNDAPALAADRLEYTMGNLWNYGFADLDQIRSAYHDLAIGMNESGREEIMFSTPETAVWFTRSALKNAYVYVADEDRFAMQALADLLHWAMERNVIYYEDLWTTEHTVISRLQTDPDCKARWDEFCKYAHLLQSAQKPDQGYWVRIGAKKRWIDPCAVGLRRVSTWNALAASEIDVFKALKFDAWLSAVPE